MSGTMFYISILITGFFAVALVLTALLSRQTPESQRVMDVVASNRGGQGRSRSANSVQGDLFQWARNFRGKLGLSESNSVKRRLISAGMRKGNAADIYYVSQMILPVIGIVVGWFSFSTNNLFWAGTLGVLGYMMPDFWLGRKIKKRKSTIQRSLPDAVDLLVICVEAGLGLDQALLRVGEELVISHGEIAEELTLVNLEQRAGKPRLEAWQALADRTQVEEFAGFVGMLTQTERFGTPVTKTLLRFSEDLRTQRRQRAEEAAAKTKIKIIFPLVLCIFPCIFIVLLAPAILGIMSGLSSMGNK